MPCSLASTSLPLKNVLTDTPRTSAILVNRPAPTRFTPFSYFCTCWNVTPSWFASAVCDNPRDKRSILIRCPTSTSTGSGLFTDIVQLLANTHRRTAQGGEPSPYHGSRKVR